MKRFLTSSFIAAICLTHTSVMAATPDISVAGTVAEAIAVAAQSIMPQAIIWLSSFIALQFFITNFGLLKSGGDIEAVIGKFVGSMAWFAFCFYVLQNGPDFIDSVGHDMLTKFAPNIPSFGSIVTSTLAMCTSLMFAIVLTGTSVVGTGNSAVAHVLIIVLFFVFSVGMYMAIKIAMLTLKLAIIIMLAPLSFSLLGLNALKDQGIAPFKSLISLIYRIVLLGIFCGAFSKVSKVASAQLTSVDWANPTGWGAALNVIMSMIVAYPLIVYLVYKSDSIAASAASGSTNMGAGDVAAAAAAGAAAGSAIASGGAATAGAVGKIPQGMGDVIKAMIGNGNGSVSNASSTGFGGQAAPGPAPQRSAVMSTAGGSAQERGFPRRPPDEANNSMAQSPSRATSVASNDAAPIRPSSELSNSSSNANSLTEMSKGGLAGQGSAATVSDATPGDRPKTESSDIAPGRPAAQADGRTNEPQKTQDGAKTSDLPPARPTQAGPPGAPVRPTQAGSSGAPVRPTQAGPSGAPVRPTQAGPSGAPVRPTQAGSSGVPVPPTQAGSSGAPIRPTQAGPSGSPVRPVESGTDAGISGAVPNQGASGQPQSNKPSAWEKIGKANDHIAREQAATHITINTNNSD